MSNEVEPLLVELHNVEVMVKWLLKPYKEHLHSVQLHVPDKHTLILEFVVTNAEKATELCFECRQLNLFVRRFGVGLSEFVVMF